MPRNQLAASCPKDSGDDETVMSDADSTEIPPKKKNKNDRKPRLSRISSMYDLDGDGVLDEAELAMRKADIDGDGKLDNAEIYRIVQEQLKVKKSAGYMKRLIAGLVCFVCLLACSNLATSWASATLAKDLKSEDGGKEKGEVESKQVPAMKVAATGELAAAQTVGDTYEATEMTDEQLDYRRRLVLKEIEDDPHSHAHRKLKEAKCTVMDKSGCGRGATQKISFDSDIIPCDQFDVIQTKCSMQRTVNIKRSWGDGANKNSKNSCICSSGTSIVIKDKRKKGGSDKDKKDGGDKKKGKKGSKKDTSAIKVRNKVIVFEQNDGKKWHADCDDELCYLGGTTFQGDLGDDCLLNADQCSAGLVCERSSSSNNKTLRNNKSSRYGTCVKISSASNIIVRYAKRGGYCNYNYGWDACDSGSYCEPDDLSEYWGGLSTLSSRSSGKRGGHNVGDCTDDKYSCANGYECVKSPLYGSDRWNCMATGDNDASDLILYRSSSSSSASINKYRGSGVGVCVKNVGIGQTCFDSYWCGNGNVCDGGVCVRQMRSVNTAKVVVNTGGRPIYGNEDCTNNRSGCASGYTCRPSTINGSDRWTCQ